MSTFVARISVPGFDQEKWEAEQRVKVKVWNQEFHAGVGQVVAKHRSRLTLGRIIAFNEQELVVGTVTVRWKNGNTTEEDFWSSLVLVDDVIAELERKTAKYKRNIEAFLAMDAKRVATPDGNAR